MIKKLTQAILLSAAALASGCMVNYGPQSREERSGFYVQPELSAGLEYAHWKTKHGRNGTTLPPHPGDPFLSGTTTTDSPKGDSFSPKIGAGVSGTYKDFRVTANVDMRHNLNDRARGAGIYEERNQSSDTRPESGNSRQYTQDRFAPVTIIPRIGVEQKLGDFIIRAEAGLPYSRIKTETGHMRFGKMDKARDDSWKGFGRRYGGSVMYELDKQVRVGLYLGREMYDAEFFGESAEIKGTLGAIVIDWDFW